MATKRVSKKNTAKRIAETNIAYRAKANGAKAKDEPTEHPHIVRTLGVLGGKPRIAGTRIAVWLVAARHRAEHSIADMLEDWPRVNQAQLHDALSYYHDHREEIERQIYENSEEATRKRIKTWPPELQALVELEPVKRIPIRERFKQTHGT
jgi:uncharacterized protein (DUF433 family)